MKKVLLTATVQSHIARFHLPLIDMLRKNGYEIHVAAKNNLIEKKGLRLNGPHKVYDIPFTRSPYSKSNITAYRQLKKIIYENRYDVIHCNTPVGGVITRLAARRTRKQGTKVFYTAHGFHFYRGAPLKNWLLYYPVEKWLARYTDVLITINKEDYARAIKTLKAVRVEYIPGVGLDTESFGGITVDKMAKRRELNLPEDSFVLLSVGELNKNKNHQVIIRALSKLKNTSIYYLICGNGSLESYLKKLAEKLGLREQVRLLDYRRDIGEICKSADVFVFPSLREGLGIAALEAMACGLPLIASNIRGITEYAVDGVTGFNCSPDDADGFGKAIDTLMNNREIREKMGSHNVNAVKKFDVKNTLTVMRNIYENYSG
ncbi:MAG: glycosyltransferase family 4 protein [Candidatus Margulisbacteria bacterium]|nr:glycosyltransferase family 4 protein [Candidatus Margulisiibacteriota bacterium]